MSLGIHRSIQGSFGEAHQKAASRLLLLLNKELEHRGLPSFHDAPADERGLRRLACGMGGARTFQRLGQLATEANLPWSLSRHRTERWIALPIDFAEPFSIKYDRFMFFIPVHQEFFSLPAILSEIKALAAPLGIPLSNGTLSEEHAEKLADCQPLSDSERDGYLEAERGLWLDLYQGATWGMEESTPLVVGS